MGVQNCISCKLPTRNVHGATGGGGGGGGGVLVLF